VTTAAAEEIAACAGLEIAGGDGSGTDVLAMADTLGMAETVAADDNDAADVVSALRDRH
jgi:hypothetical protein